MLQHTKFVDLNAKNFIERSLCVNRKALGLCPLKSLDFYFLSFPSSNLA